jgi:hypothetical protein
MWTRARFANEYVPGLFAVAVDSYEKKRAMSMWPKLVNVKNSKKSYEENAIRSGLTTLQEKGEGAGVTFDTQIAGPKQKWVHGVRALGVNILASVKSCELLGHPNVKTRAISSQACFA